MTDPTVRATLPQAADLLLRWFVSESWKDKTLRSETQKFLEACGKLKPLREAMQEMRAAGSQSGKDSDPRKQGDF